MSTKRPPRPELTAKVKTALVSQPGLSVKDLAERLGVNRQFMAGVLAVLKERGNVSCRQVGPARIYFNTDEAQRVAHETVS